MRLVACQVCHAQYDVSNVDAKFVDCRCGERVDTSPLRAAEARVQRCGSCGGAVTDEAESCAYCGGALARDPGKLSLICPECFARSADDSRFCTACGVAFRPEPLQLEGYEFPCPVCTALMPPRRVGGVGINECLTCHGLWVPGDGFDTLVSRAIEARRNAEPAELLVRKPRVTGSNPARQHVQYRKCPECDAFMQRRNYRKKSGVIIDTCVTHGTWLDANELEQIAGFILSGGTGAPTGPEPPNRGQREAQAAAAILQAQAARERRAAWGQRSRGGAIESVFDLLTSIFD